MQKIYEVIYKIGDRPGLYLGSVSITRLRLFLQGYQYALREMGLPVSEEEQEFNLFHYWVGKFYQLPETSLGWDDLILKHSDNETQAFYNFFLLLDQFVKEQQPSKL